ncbi:MAG TPA: TonB-dependent receptor [Rhizomicrobium sp.]|nr:TonB-dependent receptor [Rhizomicrobium sp.]
MQAKLKISCAVAAILSGCGAAYAADTSASSGLETVIVTAERRDQSVQNVPSTIQAFTGPVLSDLDITTLDNLLKYTPNVTYGNNGPGQGEIIMRGLSNGFRGNQSSGTIGNFPNVAIYLDEQSMQFPARNVDIYMADMDRIEVLEGPQGTLFGGGAEAGAVRYITKKPVLDQATGYAEAGYGFTAEGSDNTTAQVTLNVPIVTDKLAIRAVVYDERQGGYIDNVPSTFTRSNDDLGNFYFNIHPINNVCPNGLPPGPAGLCTIPNAPQANNFNIARKDFNPTTYTGGRVSALYQIDNDWNVLIAQSVDNLDADGLSVEYPTGSDFQKLQPLQVTSFTPSYVKDEYENTAWTVNGKVRDLNLIYTGGYTERWINQQMDYANYSRSAGGMYYQCVGGSTGWGSGTPSCYSPLGYWQDTIKNTHLSQELRVSTPDDWRIRAIAGAYWEQFRIYDDMNFNYKTIPACTPANLENALNGGPVCVADVRTAPGSTANDPGVRSDATAFGEDTQRGYDQTAFFASADYDILDNLTVTAGTRWYQYREFEVGSQYGTNTSCMNVPNGECGSGMINIDAAHDRKTYAGFKSRANITYHITPDIMAYYTFSQGFRPGAFNRSVSAVATGPDGKPQFEKPNGYAPDSLQNQEIGVKGTFLDNHLQVNLSAYLMQWNNVQFLFFNPPELGNTTFGINGPSYHVKGVEAQITALVAEGLTLQGSGSYNEDTQANSPCLVDNIPGSQAFGQCITEIIPKGQSTPVPFVNPFGLIGSVPAFSPKFQGNMHARYDWSWGGHDTWAMVGVSYMGSMFNQPGTYTSGNGVLVPSTTFLRYLQPAYTTFDAAVGVNFDKWTAQIYGTNLGDSHASTFTSSAQFIKSEVPLRPRVVGLKFGYNF